MSRIGTGSVKDIAEDFRVDFFNLAENHVRKLSNLSNKYDVLTKKFNLLPTDKDHMH